MRSPHAELDAIVHKSTGALRATLNRIGLALARENSAAAERAQSRLARQLTKVMASADLLGRRRLFLEVKAVTRGLTFAERDVPFLPPVPFEEAISDLLRREPQLAVGWEEAQRVYVAGGFAAARSGTQQVSEQIQKILSTSLARGTRQDLVISRIVRALESGRADAELVGINPGGFTKAYADVVFRTVTASAYSAGRRRQAQDPEVRKVIGGWRYVATLDGAVRQNHRAAHNLVAHLDDSIWNGLTPPLGYQCRCSTEMVTVTEMRSRGLIDRSGDLVREVPVPSGAAPDPGFGRVSPYGT